MLLWFAMAYVVCGLVAAAAFVLRGAQRLLPVPAPISVGARVLLFPGAFLLWPYLALRWLRAAPA